MTPFAIAQTRYGIVQRWTIGGQGSWDYLRVDPHAHRLYVAHETRVEAIDLQSGKVIGAIGGLARCHGVVISPDGKTGFISDGNANKVIMFDTKTFSKIGAIPTGQRPDGMVLEPVQQTIWVFNKDAKTATVIDIAQRKAVATVALPGHPEFPATDGRGAVFVNIEDSNSVVRIDVASRKVTANWKLPHCEAPSGIAFDKTGNRIFSVCDGNVMAIIDGLSGKALGAARIGDGPDAAAFDPDRNLAFASNEDGSLTVVDASNPKYPVTQSLQTMKGARTMALDPESGTIYTVSAKLGAVGPPKPGVRHNRPEAIPGTFTVLVIRPL